MRQWRGGAHRRTPAAWAAMTGELEILRVTTMEQRIRLAAADDLIACLSAERAALVTSVMELENSQGRSPAQQFSKGARNARRKE